MALGQVDVIEANAGGDYKAERWQQPEDLLGDGGPVAWRYQSPDGAGVRGQELFQREVRVPCLEVLELVGRDGLQEGKARWWI